jgi:DNA-binding response OmpR family regulator
MQVNQPHILLVDESFFVTRSLQDYLSELGYQVTVKNDAADALTWLRIPGNSPDLVISAQALPAANLGELFRTLRSDPASVYPPVILLAARDDIGELVAGFQAGADDYMVKPIDVIELGLRVRAVLARTQAWRPHPASPLR